MNGNKLFTGFALSGALLLGALTGCVTHVEQPRSTRVVYVHPPAPPPPPPREAYAPPPQVEAAVTVSFPGVEIRAESDFYEPLTPYGRWEVVGTYGRCWIPGRVEADWRPYCNGYWQRTDAGWFWASDEPWGWATYHYGRWDFHPQFGWYWVPQTQWAPAWVSWHEGGGYVGWAPLQPSARVAAGGNVTVNIALIAPRAFVFVEPRQFLQRVRPSTVVVNNTTIINKTVNITNIKVVNNTVINEGPRTTVIEKASGRKVEPVAVRELRQKEEAPVVVARQRAAPAVPQKQAPTPVRSAVESVEKKIQAEPQQNPGDLQKKAQAESERLKEAQNAAQEKTQKAAVELAKKNQLESEQRAKEARQIPRAESPKHANELGKKAPVALDPIARQAEEKASTNQQRVIKEKKNAVKKGAKDTEEKPHGKQPEPAPPEKPVETPPPKN